MAKGWIILPAAPDLIAGLGKRAVFDLSFHDVANLTSFLPEDVQAALAAPVAEKRKQIASQEDTEKNPAKATAPKKMTKKRPKL